MLRHRRDNDNGTEPSSREVNSLLHTLRGEQFRHSQNVLKSKTRLVSVPTHTYNNPSLPFSDIYKYAYSRRVADEDRAVPPPRPVIQDGILQHDYPRGPVPGPPIPQSWSGLFSHHSDREHNTLAFRRAALSLIFSHTPWSFGSSDVPVTEPDDDDGNIPPPLTQVCLRILLAAFPDTPEFRDELLPVLPAHFRRDVLRYTAVHAPLSTAKLHALCSPEGHTGGELIVVGPQATLQRDLLACSSPTSSSRRDEEDEEEVRQERAQSSHDRRGALSVEDGGDTWEAESNLSQDSTPPLHTLIVLNGPVSSGALFAFPATLTHLALLAVPNLTPVHRLPRICPLLEVLDLSYNVWLNDPSGGRTSTDVESILDRIEWEKWTLLRVLGLRACNVPRGVVARVNRGRWGDVSVVGIEEQTFDDNLRIVEGRTANLRLSD